MTINSFSGEYRFLSNFWPCVVSLAGEVFSSVEHAYQFAKLKEPHPLDEYGWSEYNQYLRKIKQATAGQAKKLGRTIEVRKDWDDIKLPIMEGLNYQKYQDPALKSKLLSTYPRELIEGNTWGDTFWGVCNGVGENHLGKILMKIRQELMENG